MTLSQSSPSWPASSWWSLTTIDDDDAQADTVNPFDTDVSLRPGNLYANLVLAESEQVFYPDDHDDDHDDDYDDDHDDKGSHLLKKLRFYEKLSQILDGSGDYLRCFVAFWFCREIYG